MPDRVVKRPSFQFYPADWLNDQALQACSIDARGLWITLICLMHSGSKYGELSLNSRRTPDELAAKLARTTLKKYRQLVAELETAGVLSRTENGTIYSRRMVADERARQAWRERQQKHRQVTRDVTPNVTDESRRSSSSSSSSSLKALSTESIHSEDIEPQRLPPPQGAFEKLKGQLHKPADDTAPPLADPATPNGKANGSGQQWNSHAWVEATAKLVEITHRPNEPFDAFKDRVHGALQQRLKRPLHPP